MSFSHCDDLLTNFFNLICHSSNENVVVCTKLDDEQVERSAVKRAKSGTMIDGQNDSELLFL